MYDNHILNLEDAAKRVHATPETLLQYIRRGELPAARVGKSLVVTSLDLVAFIQDLARRQSMERRERLIKTVQHDSKDERDRSKSMQPPFVQLPEALTQAITTKRKGRRTQLPPLVPGMP